MKKTMLFLAIGFVVLSFLVPNGAFAAAKVYEVPSFDDFTGPYANLVKHMIPAKTAVLQWWSNTEGKKLGVALKLKSYDTRYDASTVVSMWPGILAGKPIIGLGNGAACAAALQERLPKDKVPFLWATPGYGYGWLPNQWVFYPRPTYIHEVLGFLNWFIKEHPEKRPVRVATMTFQGSPGTQDYYAGLVKYVKEVLEPKGLAKLVATEWIDFVPVDVSSQLRKLVEAKADIVFGIIATGMATAYLHAEQLLGVSIPTFSHNFMTIWPVGKAMKTFKPWEGHYNGGAVVSPAETDSKAYDFVKLLCKEYGLKDEAWSPGGMLGLTQGILAVRAVERAAKKVGGANLTGQAVYDAFFAGPFTEESLMGIMPTQYFSKEAPFSCKDLKMKINVVKDGKYQLAIPEWVPIPSDIQKW